MNKNLTEDIIVSRSKATTVFHLPTTLQAFNLFNLQNLTPMEFTIFTNDAANCPIAGYIVNEYGGRLIVHLSTGSTIYMNPPTYCSGQYEFETYYVSHCCCFKVSENPEYMRMSMKKLNVINII